MATLQAFISDYITNRVDVKPATREIWSQGERGLVDFFGGGKAVREITAGGADNYKMHLIGKKLAPMTIRKRLQFAKTVFRSMIKHRLIDTNPFAEVSVQATMDPNRQHFISQADTDKLLESARDWVWRTIIALARFGGLRCPSEVLSLKLDDIDWKEGRIKITSPKTEHHAGKETRLVPLFPELRPYLEEASEAGPMERCMWSSDTGKARWDPKAGGTLTSEPSSSESSSGPDWNRGPACFTTSARPAKRSWRSSSRSTLLRLGLGTPRRSPASTISRQPTSTFSGRSNGPTNPSNGKNRAVLLHHIAAKSGAVSCGKRQ